MTPEQARLQWHAAQILRDQANELAREAEMSVARPRPGSFVRDVRNGNVYVVILQEGQLMLDAFQDDGRKPPSLWIWYDVIQEGSPALPPPRQRGGK